MNQTKNIVILGGGFGGISAAKTILKHLPQGWRVVLIDKNPHHVFHPALYEVASATLFKRPLKRLSTRFDFMELMSGASFQIEEIFEKEINRKTFVFLQKEIKDIFLTDRDILFTDNTDLKFDYLIFALGSETNYFNVPQLKERAMPLKNIYDAVNIRSQIHEIFERKQPNQRISVVVGGGGFTGCEFAAELAHSLGKLAVTHPHWRDRIKITLVEATNQLLTGAKDWIQEAMKKRLGDLGVSLSFGNPIAAVRDSNVVFKNGEELYYDLLIWTAGVKGNPLIEHILNITVEKGCKILVNNYLQAIPHQNVFGVGDNIFCYDPAKTVIAPSTAQGAIEQGKLVGENIVHRILGGKLAPYSWKGPIFVVPAGGKNAFSEIAGFRLQGWPAWFLHELAFLQYFMSILPAGKAFGLWFKGLGLFTRND